MLQLLVFGSFDDANLNRSELPFFSFFLKEKEKEENKKEKRKQRSELPHNDNDYRKE